MPKLSELPERDQQEVETTKDILNNLFQTVLGNMEYSTGVFRFAQPVQFKSYSLDSIPAKDAAGIVMKLYRQRQLLIAVETSFNTELCRVGQFSLTGKEGEPKFIGAFFVGNFIARCNVDGPGMAERIVKDTIGKIVYHDTLMSVNGVRRMRLPETNSLVSIFAGTRTGR